MLNKILKKVKSLKFSENPQSGFSIVEMITTIFVFSIMALVVSAVLIRALQIERQAFAAQIVQENALAVLELLAKEIRTSNIVNQNNNCTTDPIKNSLTITSYSETGTAIPITYSLNASGIIERTTGGYIYQISSPDVIFNSFRFCVFGSGTALLPADNRQARVAILAQISNRQGTTFPIKVNIQTTVNSRDIFDEIQN